MVCWPNRPMPYDLHKRQTYCLINNVWTCAKQKPLLKLLFLLCYSYVLLRSKALKHTLLVDHSSLLHFKTTWPPQLIRMHLYEHEIPLASLVISIVVLIYFYLINSQAFWHSFVQRKVFVFLVSLVISAIIVIKFLMKHL